MVVRIIISMALLSVTSVLSWQGTSQGEASYYADKFEGRLTASGEPYQGEKFTAAHRTLPFGTKVEVTNLKNKRTVVVRINDRGPHVKRRIIDLSRAAAEKLDFIKQGVTRVSVKVLEE